MAVASALQSAKYVFFDLDDTLHSFRAASSTATTATLSLILSSNQRQEDPVTLPALRAEYANVLQHSTSVAFTDGKTSHEYRASRFSTLLSFAHLPCTESTLQKLLDTYETALCTSLALKPGALSLLTMLKAQGKKIVVVTEGPQDAQERTIETLGLGDWVDVLVTSNKLGVGKTEGLFARCLESFKVGAGDVVVVGDSWERDIVPASTAGVWCIWFAEKEEEGVRELDGREMLVVNSLGKIQGMVDAL